MTRGVLRPLARPRGDSKGLTRRALLAGGAMLALAPRRARADVDPQWRPRELDVREVHVDGTQSRRFVLAAPRHLERWERVPLAVLLHGLGETGDERTGAWAWLERYGLGSSYDRLRAAGTLRGLVLACPYMPDLPVADPGAFDAYARWIVETVVPRARAEARCALDSAASTYLAGCSLGGHFSLEVLLRRPADFGAWAGVQTAISAGAGEQYARKLAALTGPAGRGGGAHALLVETSTGDPFRAGNEALDRGLEREAHAHAFVELPGPHDQTWLRASGTARMLQWLDDLPRPELRPEEPLRRAESLAPGAGPP